MALPPALLPVVALLAVVGLIAVLFSSAFIFSFITASLVLVLSISLAVLFTQPFTGALVRLRANYLPKAVSLDNVLEDGAGVDDAETVNGTGRKISAYLLSQQRQTAKIGPVVSGIFPMLFRTKKLEGWAGVYKGAVPSALQLLLLGAVIAIFFDTDRPQGVAGGAYKSAPTRPGEFGFVGNLFFMAFVAVVTLPINVITYRAIVHPRILSWSPGALSSTLNEILSPAERAQPWRLYLIPGLLATTFAHIGWVGLLTRAVRHILVPNLGGLAAPQPAGSDQTDYSGPDSSSKEVNPLALVIYLGWCLFSVIALSPLEIVAVRLAVQRPDRQQPLHLAYARLANERNRPSGPASYSHQATVAVESGPATAAGFKDSVANSKPLPSEPPQADGDPAGEPEPGRPSFAIEDEDDVPEDGQNALPDGNEARSPDAPSRPSAPRSERPSKQAPSSAHGLAQPNPNSIPDPAPYHPRGPGSSYQSVYAEPSEPVIALRPVEEPTIDAARGAGSIEPDAAVVQRYDGLKDCIDKLIEEEGVEALYRGAWVTAMGIVGGGLGA